MRTFNLLASLIVIFSSLFAAAAPLDLAVDTSATVQDPPGRRLVAKGASSRVGEILESLHDRGDTTSFTTRDAQEAVVNPRRVSVVNTALGAESDALIKRFGNFVSDSAQPDIHTLGKRQPQPIIGLHVRAQAQADAAASADLLGGREFQPITNVNARAQAQVDAAESADLLGRRGFQPITNVNARAQAQVDAPASADLLLKRDPNTILQHRETAVTGLGSLLGGIKRVY